MRWTNKFGMSETAARAVQNAMRDYRKLPPFALSTTQAIGPIRIAHLRTRHWDEMTEDVSAGIWRLLGKAVHYIVEKGEADTDLVEVELFKPVVTIGGQAWGISGQPDIREASGRLNDTKLTSVWKAYKGDLTDWTAQLNWYADLYEDAGFPCTDLRIEAYLRDWSPTEFLRYGKDGYPPIQYMVLDIERWAPGVAAEHMAERIGLFVAHLDTPDDDLPVCTPEERWQRDKKFGLKKKANKTFSGGRKTDSLEDLVKWGLEKNAGYLDATGAFVPGDKWELQEIPGVDHRCESDHPVYCPVRQWCSHYQNLKRERGEQDDQNAATGPETGRPGGDGRS